MGVESFGVWLDGELERAKLNRAGLAALVGVTEATVSGWRYGRNAPKARNIQAIARVLTVPVTEVYAALGRIPPDTELSPARRRILEILAGKTEKAVEHYEQVLRLVAETQNRDDEDIPRSGDPNA